MARQVRKNPDRVVDAVARAMSGADAAIAERPESREFLRRVVVEAFRQGPRGAARDVVLLGSPWGFELGEIRVPVCLWQGEADLLVPPAMGMYLAATIPGCTARFYPSEGHLLVVDHMAKILDEFRAG